MKLLLVEDSVSVRRYVEGVLASTPDVTLLPPAVDGAAGVRAALIHRPDVILMDLELPILDGLEAIARIMAEAPCPIVVFSGTLRAGTRDRTFEAFHAGAVDVLAKPQGLSAGDVSRFRERLVDLVRLMAGAQVIRRRPRAPSLASPPSLAVRPRLVVVGGSTGGPEALLRILQGLRPPLEVPVVVAQHILAGFEYGLAEWLSQTGHSVVVADRRRSLARGEVVVAPATANLLVAKGGVEPTAVEREGMVPSVDLLFESAAAEFGAASAGVLLSGMGDDGARGLHRLRELGAPTVTQLGESCVVDGMPAAARARGASCLELAPDEIAAWLSAQIGGAVPPAPEGTSPP